MVGGEQGLAVAKRQAPAGKWPRSGRAPSSPGHRGRPPRSQLVRAERGNPVEVRARSRVLGRPTVRRAELLGGNRMTEKRIAGGRKATGDHGSWASPPTGRHG